MTQLPHVDICIVGTGASGSTLAYYLSEAGLSVSCLDAGPFREPLQDFASDELEMEKLFWNEPRISMGKDPINLSRNNSGKGVGGSAVHYTAQMLRFHHSDFKTKSIQSVGQDWPIRYEDVAPYYDKIQKTLLFSGPAQFPWKPYGGKFPLPQHHDLGNNALKFRAGCESLGMNHTVSPLAILSAPYGNRHPCINRGFCEEGCMPDAKTTPLNSFIPLAQKNGVSIQANTRVIEVLLNNQGKIHGVRYIYNGKQFIQTANVVVLASHAIETPRLLLHSKSNLFPNGLANSSGLVGKYLMANMNDQMIVKFDEEIRMYRGNPVQALTLDPYEEGEKTGNYARGFLLNSYGSRPVRLARLFNENNEHLWGETLRNFMLDYNFYGSFAMLGEMLPSHENCIKLSDQVDEFGVPIPEVHMNYSKNDHSIRNAAKQKLTELAEASGGKSFYHLKTTAHLLGGCRMGDNTNESVVNSFGQTHDVSNLFIIGTPTFVTAPSANPTFTVYALALRSAEYILEEYRKGNLIN
ncbi:GMC family oxidoreductase [Bacillus solimangrovi]|uniref:Oxidoreductase n=1 Tax=Bacillus solimangrovi TaxID=1305675 RepID=A0A1E5LJS0_9BACI|nr:GMC family oxidoreductase [Bacillus solimangrovi]OEH94349.1 hypothetical protein BFG57_08825 [Bacillus solimangrovi]